MAAVLGLLMQGYLFQVFPFHHLILVEQTLQWRQQPDWVDVLDEQAKPLVSPRAAQLLRIHSSVTAHTVAH